MSQQQHSTRSIYLQYLAEYGKSYDYADELERRARVFAANDKFIREWNSQRNGTMLGHNRFSDWEDEEFRKIILRSRSHSRV